MHTSIKALSIVSGTMNEETIWVYFRTCHSIVIVLVESPLLLMLVSFPEPRQGTPIIGEGILGSPRVSSSFVVCGISFKLDVEQTGWASLLAITQKNLSNVMGDCT